MLKGKTFWTAAKLAGASAAALAACSANAFAGGFQINEQTTVFLGSASAGAAAGGSIGSMYYNPAAAAQFSGLNTESSYTLVMPNADVHVNSVNLGGGPIPVGGPAWDTGDIGIDALTSSTYGTYQFSKDLWLGISLAAPFGLGTKPSNPAFQANAFASPLGLTTKVLTFNANPTVAYRIAPGVTIGAGIQIEYARGKLQNGDGAGGIAEVKGDDIGVGATAGIMIEPARGTTIGLGYRSGITHDLDGRFLDASAGAYVPASGKLKLPDLVTLSLRQELTPNFRLLGTVEWTGWSSFDSLAIRTPVPGLNPTLLANWSDGWYFSVGGEYDYTPWLTLRAGVGYELTPEDSPTKVLTTDPDGDRVWLSIGASYQLASNTTIDVGYSHIFVDGGDFVRSPPASGPAPVYTGTFDASADLISVGMRTRW